MGTETKETQKKAFRKKPFILNASASLYFHVIIISNIHNKVAFFTKANCNIKSLYPEQVVKVRKQRKHKEKSFKIINMG